MKGTRKIDGRYYWLAGRGSKHHCVQEARVLRQLWRLVRIVPAGPHGAQLDDWMIYVFERRPEPLTADNRALLIEYLRRDAIERYLKPHQLVNGVCQACDAGDPTSVITLKDECTG
jgi:hypothetical protein